MDLMTTKKQQFEKALASLKEVLAYSEKNAIIRDSSIQRFEYTAEIFWKMLREYLHEEYGILVNSPKQVIREAVGQNVFSAKEGELFLQMLDDRNRTSHAYEESIAEEISGRLEKYATEMEDWYQEIR